MNAYFEMFEAGIDRRNTGCAKWDERLRVFGREDVLPLWVADMDFAAPDPIIQAIIKRTEHGAFGYSTNTGENAEAVGDWIKARHGIDIQPDWISTSVGVVDSMYAAVAALTKPGDKIAVQPPL